MRDAGSNGQEEVVTFSTSFAAGSFSARKLWIQFRHIRLIFMFDQLSCSFSNPAALPTFYLLCSSFKSSADFLISFGGLKFRFIQIIKWLFYSTFVLEKKRNPHSTLGPFLFFLFAIVFLSSAIRNGNEHLRQGDTREKMEAKNYYHFSLARFEKYSIIAPLHHWLLRGSR